MVRIQWWQCRQWSRTGCAYQVNGRTPSMRGGGREWASRFGVRWGTTGSEKSGEGVRRCNRVPRMRNMSLEESNDLNGSWGMGDVGGEAQRKERREEWCRLWSLADGHMRRLLLRPTPPQRHLCNENGLQTSDKVLVYATHQEEL
jgi:hypothetical protein